MTNSIPEYISKQVGKYKISFFPKTMMVEIEQKTGNLSKKFERKIGYQTIMNLFSGEFSEQIQEKDFDLVFSWIEDNPEDNVSKTFVYTHTISRLFKLLSRSFQLKEHIPTLIQNKFLKALIQEDEQSIIESYEDDHCPEELMESHDLFYNNPNYFDYFEKSSKYQLFLLENPQYYEERLQLIAKHCTIASSRVYEEIVNYYKNHDQLSELFYELVHKLKRNYRNDDDDDVVEEEEEDLYKEQNERIIDKIIDLQKRFPDDEQLITSIVSCFTHRFNEDTIDYSIFQKYMKDKVKIKIEWV